MLVMEKREINVYHHLTGSAHMICHESHVTLPLKAAAYDDYLFISIFAGPGHLYTKSLVHLPSWADFEFSTDNRTVSVCHSGDRFIINIPPGPPTWNLKLTRSATTPVTRSKDSIIITSE
jgi:hypothetical protein